MRRAALALAGLLLAAGPARAQEREPASLRFARALTERGWTDLAGVVLDGLAQDRTTSAALRAQLDLLRDELLTREATSAPTAREREEKAAAARAMFEQFARSRPGSVAGVEARLRVGELRLQVGEAALRRLRDPAAETAAREPDRAEARASFEAAAAHFVALEAELLAAVQQAPDPSRDDVYRLSLAALLGGRAMARGALCFDPGPERDAALGAAILRLQELAASYADVPDTAAEAQLLVGLSERERGRLEAAAAAFDGAAELLVGSGLVAEGRRLTDPYLADLLGRALYHRAQTLCDLADWPGALEAVKRCRVYLPDALRGGDPVAQLLEVEHARALSGSGDPKAGLALLDGVLARPANPAVAHAAAVARRALSGQAPGGGLAPDDALHAAEALLERGEQARGLEGLRRLVAELEASQADGALLPRVWLRLGRGYLASARLDEAAACLELLARRWPRDPAAPRALFDAATCAGRLAVALPNELDLGRQARAFEALKATYPDAPETHAGAFLRGNLALADKRYVAAAALHDQVPAAAGELHEAALYQSALAWSLEARARAGQKDEVGARDAHGRAVAAFERGVARAAPLLAAAPAGEPRAAALGKLVCESWLRLAELHLLSVARDPARALEAARRAEVPGSPPARVGEARALAVQAHLAAGDLAAAEAALVTLVAVAPELRRTADAERDVAAALDATVSAGPDALARAADHYARWLASAQAHGHPVTRLQAARAGDRLFRLALLLNGLPAGTFGFSEVPDGVTLPAAARFEQAARAYELAAGLSPAAGEPASDQTAPWLVEVKLGECLGFLGRLDGCVAAIDRALALERLIDGGGNIVPAVARTRTPLLHAYADAALAARLLGQRTKDRALLRRAATSARRLVVVCPVDGELWWRSKTELLLTLSLEGDYTSAGVGLRSLRRTYPDFDGGRFGQRAKLEGLAAELATKRP